MSQPTVTVSFIICYSLILLLCCVCCYIWMCAPDASFTLCASTNESSF